MTTRTLNLTLAVLLCGAASMYAAQAGPAGMGVEPPPEALMPPPDGPPPPPPPPGAPGAPGEREHGPGRRVGRQWRGPEGMPPLEHVRKWLQKKDPAELARLEQLRKDDPEAFRNEMRKCLRDFAQDVHPEMKAHFEQQRAAMRELHALVGQYRASTNDAERAALEQQIREKLTAAFDARQELRKKELQQLAQRIEELNQAVHTREENKAAMIDEHLKALVEGKRPAEW